MMIVAAAPSGHYLHGMLFFLSSIEHMCVLHISLFAAADCSSQENPS